MRVTTSRISAIHSLLPAPVKQRHQEQVLPTDKATQCTIFSAVRRLARKRRSTGDGGALPLSLGYKVHVASVNNFPTAAGLASSAAGYACLGGCPQTPGTRALSVVVGVSLAVSIQD